MAYPTAVNDKIYNAVERQFASYYGQVADLSERHASECGAMEHYLPTLYLPQAVGITIAKLTYASPALMVLLARLGNLAVYIGVVFLLIKRLKVGKWLLVVVALLPARTV